MNSLNDYDASYQKGLEGEYKIIEILNNKINKNIKFIRNKIITDIDAEIYKFDKLVGYLEIEISNKVWVDDYPANWKTISYLTRKLWKYNYDKEFWLENEFKKNIKKCVYVKFNNNLTKCHAEYMPTIIKKYIPHYPDNNNLNIDYRNITYHRIEYDKKYIMTTDQFIDRLEKWIKKL